MATCPPNKLGITDPDELQRVESAITSAAITGILTGETPLPPRHGIDRLTAIHRHLFADIYEHGGHLRDGPLAKPEYEGGAAITVFTHPARVRGELEQLFADLQREDALKGLGRLDFAERGAGFLTRLNQAHVFREGNGRTQRTYLQLVALDAGHHLPMRYITQDRMVDASIQASRGDQTALREILHEQLDTTRLAALRGAYEWLDSSNYTDLNNRILATATPGQHYAGVLVAKDVEHFVMMDGRQSIIVGNTADLPNPDACSNDRISFTARRTPLQELDHRFNLAEQASAPGAHVAGIEAVARDLGAAAGGDRRTRACIAKRHAEAAARDAAYQARHQGISRPPVIGLGR